MFSLKYLHSIVTQNRLQHIINIFYCMTNYSVEIQILICYTNHVLDCGVRTIHDGMLYYTEANNHIPPLILGVRTIR